MLYMETSQILVKAVMSVRRILYVHDILTRHMDEHIVRVYSAMKNKPLKGDRKNTVTDDMKDIDINLQDEEISQFSKIDFKSFVKKNMKVHMLNEVNAIKECHSKVKHLVHSSLDAPQDYLISGKFSNSQCSLLFNLRSKGVNEFKSNMQSSLQYSQCLMFYFSDDMQKHALLCQGVRKHLRPDHICLIDSVVCEDLVAPLDRKLQITNAYQIIINQDKREFQVYFFSQPSWASYRATRLLNYT